MINLNPINKKIRQTLAKRSAALKRDVTDTNPLAPVSDELVNTTSRSVWVKMFSPVIVKNDGVVVALPQQEAASRTSTTIGKTNGTANNFFQEWNEKPRSEAEKFEAIADEIMALDQCQFAVIFAGFISSILNLNADRPTIAGVRER